MSSPRPLPGPVGPSPEPATALAAALDLLPSLPDRPVHEHVEVYDDVHRQLQAQLAALDGV